MFASAATVALAAFATLSSATPVVKRADAINDTVVLNFALTLEHLENAFYKGALAKYDAAAFANDGMPIFVRNRFVQIGAHEQAHVDFLSGALGSAATKPCTYSFPYNSPSEFAALAMTLEGVGVSAYTGAAQFITDKTYLTVAASVLATEARHASWVSSAVRKVSGWSGALDVALPLSAVYNLAAQFIVDCPKTNPSLPVKSFPSLTLASPAPGKTVKVTYGKGASTSGDVYISFYSGLSQTLVKVSNGEVKIPAELVGTVYAVATSSSSASSDATTLAGPAILAFNMDSTGKVIQ